MTKSTSPKRNNRKKKVGEGSIITYTPEVLIDIENAATNGALSTNAIAGIIGIKPATLSNHRYRRQSPEAMRRSDAIETAIKRGCRKRQAAVKAVAEDSLLKLIQGYELIDETEEVKTVVIRGKNGQRVEMKTEDGENAAQITRKRTIKKFGPNVTAVLFALCNSDGERWKSIYNRNNNDEADENENRGTIMQWMRGQLKKARPE